ncbi:MAG: phenylalanine--tRNA ligase subunit beta [Rhodospirillales bacterium]|nr:phenylalanine--tRNA ligase subunit beta [Rhodospirillales bacterium]
MKFTLSWLRAHLATDAGPAAIGAALTRVGHEVEAIVDRGAALKDFVVARVVEAGPHPNADKLKVCVVDAGGGRHAQVVCGAPNARAGLIGVFAPPGSLIPGSGVVLKTAAVRGVESAGMLLSEREMGLSDEHTGIVELAADTTVGAPAAAALGLDDPLFDIAVTPDRGDCLGVRGIARDLAAAGLGTLKPLDTTPVAGRFVSPIGVHLEFEAETASACPYFVGRLIRGLRNGPSPKWLADRLTAIGLRPISALVDITNFLTYDLCRPLHVFDAAKVRGGLHVRLARCGERLAALNGKTYDLTPAMTVIADDADVEALGGVIGGERTGCTAETTEVFLESALFDPVRTALTGRSLGILSDARFRFERGIDAAFLIPGMDIATRLILELCGGEPSITVIAGDEPRRRPAIIFRPARVRSLTGMSVPEPAQAKILADLGFAGTMTGERWSVDIPTWRNDVEGEACLVEEVARIHGYDHIPAVSLSRAETLPKPVLTAAQRARGRARRRLAERGLVECVTYSFLPSPLAALFGGGQPSVRLVNPISADLDQMRPSLLPNLIAAAARNADRGLRDGALFEVGPEYAGIEPGEQRTVAAAIRFGRTGPRHWAAPPRAVDAFDAKADAFDLLASLGVATRRLETVAEAPGWYHPGRSATLRLGPKVTLARFGEVHPRVLKAQGLRGPVVACEVFLDSIPARRPTKGAPQLSPFQSVERDFAFVLDAGVPAEALVRAARAADEALIADVRVFDQFAGGALGEGRKSLAISVTLQPAAATMTDGEIEAISQRIIANVAAATGGQLRA